MTPQDLDSDVNDIVHLFEKQSDHILSYNQQDVSDIA